jgi:hypothetical protein
MHGEVAYRQLVLSEKGKERSRLPLTAPVNDLLGQLRPDPLSAVYLAERYPEFVPTSQPRAVLLAFETAARDAVKGRVSAAVAPHLERLRLAPDGTVRDVPDFAALAAWSLLESVRRQPLKLFTCPTCKGKWLGLPDGSKYCQRLAPGQVSKDCRTLDYERRLAGDSAYRGYRREYKRLSEAQRRGSLDMLELVRWRDQNGPANWLPFDQWKVQQQKGGTDG